MSWERDPLWSKARLYCERGFTFPREDPQFGFWCALGLELLARAALASVSPTLLADPVKNHRNLLYALGLGTEQNSRNSRSIPTSMVFKLCKILFQEFTDDNFKVAMALVNRRNEELHSGAAAFEEYPCKYWLNGFYACCNVLTAVLNESLDQLFGTAEADIAREALENLEEETVRLIKNRITTHKSLFLAWSDFEQEEAKTKADLLGSELSHKMHHRVICPACECTATVQGDAFGPKIVTPENDVITVRQAVAPRKFSCPACSLKFLGHAELKAAGLSEPYTRTVRHLPEEYYGLIDPDDPDAIQALMDDYFSDMAIAYDNE